MNQFKTDLKRWINKINTEEISREEGFKLIESCAEKIYSFQLFSLALKYYSYLERINSKADVKANHDGNQCNHEHHNQDRQAVRSSEIELEAASFKEFVNYFTNHGKLPENDEIIAMRERLKKAVSVLTAYGDEIALLENVYFKTRYKNEKMMVMDNDETFAKYVTDVLMENGDAVEIREHLKIIYPELPMRMTKNKFYGFVDEYFIRLKGIPAYDVKEHIDLIKETFAPERTRGYGEVASDFARELEKVKAVICGTDLREKDSAYHHMYHLTEDKNEILEQALDLAELLNHLYGMALTDSFVKKYETYNVVRPLLNGETDENKLASVFREVEMSFEPLGDALLDAGAVLGALRHQRQWLEQWGLKSGFNEVEYAYELTKEGYFIERTRETEDEMLSLNDLMIIKDDLIKFMDSTFKEDKREMRRGRMSIMMSIFQMVHSAGQDIYDHIYESIHACEIQGEKAMCMQNVYSYLNDISD